jgi:hypothetical protein
LGNYTDTDGAQVIHYLEGVEHQYYCFASFEPTAEPRWRPVVNAERNLTKLLRDNYLTLVVVRNVSLAYFARFGHYLEAADAANSSLAKAAAESVREYLALLNKAPNAVPLYHTAPDSYRGQNVLIACVMYDWRAPVNLTAALYLHPAREWWVASYPMGDSRVARHVAEAKADMFKYVFGTPPPPPPVNLSGFVKQWRIPWNNRTLPYTPYYHPDMKMPPPDNKTGIPLWNIQNLEDIQMVHADILSWAFTVLFVTILSIVAVFEFLGALFDFPTPIRAIYGFVANVILDWIYWLPFRIAVRGRLIQRVWLAVKRPVMRGTVRAAARAHTFFASRMPALRRIRSPDLKEYFRRYALRREIAVRDPAEQVREEVKTKAKKDALERLKRAVEDRVEWVLHWQRRIAEEAKARLEPLKKIWNIVRAEDIIEVARELSPRFDAWIQKKVEESRGSWTYHLFWWKVDKLPYIWRVMLSVDPHVVTRLVAEGKVKPEDAAAFLNLRAAIEAYVRELRWRWTRLHSVSPLVKMAEKEYEKARQKMIREAERGLADFSRFTAEFQRHFEDLRRYFAEDLSRLDEGERKKLEEAVRSVTERLSEALRHFAAIDKAPRARLISALNEALQHVVEGKAPHIPRDASVQDVVRHLTLMDFDLAMKALRSAEKYLETHYAVAPTRYDTRQIAAEVVKGKIGEQLPTLQVAGAARGIVLGGRSVKEGEALLKAWRPRDPHGERWAIVGGRFAIVDVYEGRPWEAVVGRFSYLHEQPLNIREVVAIKPDIIFFAEYSKYLAGFRAEDRALEVLRKAVEYSRIMRILEHAEELRLTPLAVERLTADAERLKQEVLRETAEIYRKFREEFFFVKDLLEGHRVVRREVPEVREVVKAFEEALTEALKAPQRRERVFREAFMERVERLVEEHARRGDVEAVERIRRAAAEMAKFSETVGWRAVEDVTAVLPAVGRAFEEALRAVEQSRDPARFAETFKARAEEAAKQLEQIGMQDAAARVRRAAEKIVDEFYAGGWGAVERLKPLLLPERAGEVLGRLEFLTTLFSGEALEVYRGLVFLRHLEELTREVKGLASMPKEAAEVLRRAAEAAPVKDEAEKVKAALRAGRWAEAAEGLTRVVNAAGEWKQHADKAAGGVEEAIALGRRAEALDRRISELLPRALNADAVKPALEAAVNRDYNRALVLLEAAERSINERIAAVRDVEPSAKALERLGIEAARLGLPEYRQRAVREVEEVVAALRGLADLPTAVQRVDAEKAAKAAEAFGLAEAASLFRAVEKVRKEAGDAYPIFVKAAAEALKAPEGERVEVFKRVFTAETEKMVKAFEERGILADAENVKRAAEAALKISETIGWKAPEEAAQRLPSAVEEGERLAVRLRDEATTRQISEYGYYSALASLAREAKEAVTARRDVEEKLAKLIDDVKPAVELIAPFLKPLLERLKAGNYSVIPALEAELPKLAERHRQLDELAKALTEVRKKLEKFNIEEKVKKMEKTLKKAPEDVKAVFDEALKVLKGGDLERASKELDKILEFVEEKRSRLQQLEGEIQKARDAAERLGLSNVLKALERPTGKSVAKALGELERELAKIYGAHELLEYVKRPRADADFGHAWGAARVLGLEEADKLFSALSHVSLYLLREGREIFRNPLYDEVKHLIDQEHVRALVRAPMYSYIIDRLGPDVLQPTYARWYDLFVEYGSYLATAYEHAKTSAVVARAPVSITGGFSYGGKMMRWLGDFSQEAVMRGLKAYYKGEGRGFRELSEMTIRGAKIQLFETAASFLMVKAAQMHSEAGEDAAKRLDAEVLRLLAFVLRARAAYEEVRLIQTYLKGAQRRAEVLLREAERESDVDRKLALEVKAREVLEAAQRKAERYLADARARYKAYLAEIKDFVWAHGDVRELAMNYFGLTARAFAGDPEAVAERMMRAVDVRRVISWVDELKLPKELGEIAIRITDSERVYNKFEKILRAKVEPIPPVYDLERAGRFFVEEAKLQPPPKPHVEEAVSKVVRDVLTAYYGRLKEAAEKAAAYLALVKNDTRLASKEVKKAYQKLKKALEAKDKEEVLKALEDLKAALKALGIEAEGEDVKTVLKAVEEKLRPAYEEYLSAKREYVTAVEAIAKFSPEAALALVETAREGGVDSIARWMSLVAYKTGKRALEEYARYWAKPVEERWDALPQAVREIIARREEEAVYELVRGVLKSAGIGVRRGVEMDLKAYEEALERVFTANGEWPELRDYVKQVIEAARRVQRGEASTDELTKTVDELFRAYGAVAADRFVRSDRLEDAVEEMHEGMRHYARNSGLKIRREAAERALLLGLSVMPEELVERYARDGWRGRLEPYVAYWTEDEKLARRAGEAGWEVRQIQRPISFEEGVPKEWRTAYVVAPFGFDLSAVERAVAEHVDGAPGGVAQIRAVGWPAPEAYLWFILKDRQPVKEGEWIVAYSIDRLSIEEPLSKFGETLRARNYDEMKKTVRELYEARFNRTLWQIVYEFDRERAEAALEYLRQKYGEPENRLWERHDELYLTWLGFRLADEFEAYLRSGAGREFKTKEEFGELLALGRWLPVELAPLFWLRLVGDAEGEAEFRAAWVTAVNKWLEGMAAPYTPKKPAVARKAVELFNAFTGAGFKHEELFPPPKPAEAARPETAAKPEAVKPAEAKREAVKPETAKPVKPAEAAKPEAKPVEPAERPVAEIQKPEERGLRREAEKQAVKPEAVTAEAKRPEVAKPETAPEAAKPAEAAKPETKPVQKPTVEVERGLRRDVEKATARPEAVKPTVKPTEVKKPDAVKPVEPAAEAVEVRGLRRVERSKAPIADVIPERVEAVEYLVQRFGVTLDVKAAFKAKDFVVAKVKAQLEKMSAKDPEFAHILAEVAEHVLSSFGRLMASPNAAMHVHEALFYYFEGYQTRDGELLFARIERTVREAVRRAEEAGIPDAEYRIKQFILWLIKQLEEAGERYRRDALKGIYTVEKALRATAFASFSAAALYSVYSGLYSEAVVSSVASAIALAEVGQFREAVQYAQRATKALYEAAKEAFEHVKITVQRLVELFIEAVARVLAWIDEHKAYLFLMAAVTAGAIALSVALNIWGLVELEKLVHAATLAPFVPAGVKEYSREEVFNILRSASDPYERFKEIAKEANVGKVKLAEPWESLRKLIMPKKSEEDRLMSGGGAELYSKYREDENYKRALFYATLALEEALAVYKPALRKLEEALGVYRTALREYVEEREKVLQKVEVGEEPFKKDMYVADLDKLARLVKEEETAFEKTLRVLRKRLTEYAVKYDLGNLLIIEESKARGLAEAEHNELSRYSDVKFNTKALAALIAYREHALGGESVFGKAARYWLEVGGSAQLLYYAPWTAYNKAERARVEKPVTVEEAVAEALRRLFLKPGADRYSRFVEELVKVGKLALMLENESKSSYMFRLFRVEEGGGLVDLGILLWIVKAGESIIYFLRFEDVERWREFFKQELEAAMGAAEVVGGRLLVKDRFSYMVGWVDSDVAIVRNKEGKRVLHMGTSHLWQLAETHALFGWSRVVGLSMSLTLEGPKLMVEVEAPLEKLDEAIKKSAESGWLHMLGTEAGLENLMHVKSWDGLKRWVAGRWDDVVDAAVSRLREVLKEEELEKILVPKGRDAPERRKGGQEAPRDKQKDGKNVWEELRSRLKTLRDKLDDDKIAREAVAPALLLIQAEKLGVNEETLKYFGAVIYGTIGGDGYVSAAMKRIELASGEREIALLWGAAFAAYDIETKIGKGRTAYRVNAFGDDAARLARYYFLYGVPLLEGDERVINHKRAEAVELGAEGLNIRWERLREIKNGAAVYLIISDADTAVEYNVYLRDTIMLYFESTDRSRAELAALILKLAGVTAEVNKWGDRNVWRVTASTDMLAAGRKEFRDALAEIVKKAEENDLVKADKAERWLEKLESGRMLKEEWPNVVQLVESGALMVRYSSTNRNSIEQMAQRLRAMGLEEGKHFTVKIPQVGREGYVWILRKGLEHATWLSVHGEGEQQRLAADFVEHILQMAKSKGDDVRKKVEEIVIKGIEKRSLELERFEKKVEVNGKTYVVKVTGGEAVKEDRGGKKLLRIKITAEVNGVKSEYVITYGRYRIYRNNEAMGFAYISANAPGGREADAERLAAVIKALTGKEPRIRRMEDGRIEVVCSGGHLDGFMRFTELADAIEEWLEETGRSGRRDGGR